MTHSDIPTPPGARSSTAAGTVIGLDIGGTKTRGVRFEDGAPVADESVGSANVQNVTPEEAARNLAELFARIGGGSVDQVYAGAGGIDTDDDAAALAALIAPHVPGRQNHRCPRLTPPVGGRRCQHRRGRDRGHGLRRMGQEQPGRRKPAPGAGATCSATKAAATGWAGRPCGTACAG